MLRSESWKSLLTSIVPGNVMSGLKSASLPSVLFQVSRDLRLTGFESGLVLSSQSAMGAIFGLGGGMITDRLGITRMFRAGVLLMSLGVFLAAFASDFYTLTAVFLIASFGVTIYLPATFKFLASMFSQTQRGLAIGILGMSVRTSAASTFLAVPLIIGGLGSWRWVFAAIGGVSIGLNVLIYSSFRKFKVEEPSAITSRNPSATSDLKQVLRSRTVILTALSRIFLSGSSQSLSSFLPFLLQLTGSSLTTASVVATVYWITQAAGSIIIPRISDVLNRRVVLVTITSPLATVLVLMLIFAWGNPLFTIIIAGALGFLIAGLIEVTWLIPLADPQIRGRHAGAATGVLSSLGAIGGIASTIAVGSLIDISKQNVWPILVFIATLQLMVGLVTFFIREARGE